MKNIFKSPNSDPAIRKLDHFVEIFVLAGILSIILLVCCSCGSTKQVSQLVEYVKKDTIYLSNIQYDSIYVYRDKYVDRSRDTLYIMDKSIEYRYKLLKDTVRIVERDSIPYEIVVYKEKSINHKPSPINLIKWFCFGICLSGFLFIILCLIKGIRSKL